MKIPNIKEFFEGISSVSRTEVVNFVRRHARTTLVTAFALGAACTTCSHFSNNPSKQSNSKRLVLRDDGSYEYSEALGDGLNLYYQDGSWKTVWYNGKSYFIYSGTFSDIRACTKERYDEAIRTAVRVEPHVFETRSE